MFSLAKLQELVNDAVEAYEASDIDPDEIEVLAGIQPNYPLTMAVAGTVTADEVLEYQRPDSEADNASPDKVFWIVTSDGPGSYDRSPYAPRALWEIL